MALTQLTSFLDNWLLGGSKFKLTAEKVAKILIHYGLLKSHFFKIENVLSGGKLGNGPQKKSSKLLLVVKLVWPSKLCRGLLSKAGLEITL